MGASSENQLWENVLVDNWQDPAQDFGTNQWDNGSLGNYWWDYITPPGTTGTSGTKLTRISNDPWRDHFPD